MNNNTINNNNINNDVIIDINKISESVIDVICDIYREFNPDNKNFDKTKVVNDIINILNITDCFDTELCENAFKKIGKKFEEIELLESDKSINIIELLNSFDKKQDFLDFFISITQTKVFGRNDGAERWLIKTNVQNLTDTNKEKLINLFNDLDLFNHNVIPNNHDSIETAVVLGATYGAMKSRLNTILKNELRLINDENRLNNIKIQILATKTRMVNLDSIYKANTVNDLDNTKGEVQVAYNKLREKFEEEKKCELSNDNLEDFKNFIKQQAKITEFTMAEYLKSENSSYNIEVIDTPIYYFKDEKKPRATTEDNAIALVKKNPAIIEDEKTVIVSGQPHAVSQKNQMISAILKYNQKEKTLELCDNKLFKMLNFVAKQENTTINNLATHLSTFAGTVFSSYQKLYSKYNEKELSNYSMDDIKQIEQHKTSLKLTEAFNAISEIVDSKLIQHK